MAAKLINPRTRAVLAAVLIAATGSTASLATYCRVNTAVGALSLNAPRGAQPGDAFSVQDIANQAAANNITISGNGATIDGAASLVLNTNGALASLMWDGSQWVRFSGLRVTDDQAQEPVSLYGTDTGGGTSIPDPLVVANLTVTNAASVANNCAVGSLTCAGAATCASLAATGNVGGATVSATGAVTGASVTATGNVQGDAVVATTRMQGPFFSAEANPALVGTSGYLRAPDADTDIITGVSAGSTYVGVAYAPTGAAWVFGNASQYSLVYGFSVGLQGTLGCTAYDGRTADTTDLTRIERFLPTAFDTTSLTRVDTPFSFVLSANEDWKVEFDLAVQSSGGTGGQFAISLPAGCTVKAILFGASSGSTAFVQAVSASANTLIAVTFSNAAAAERNMRIVVVVRVGATPGNFVLQTAAVTGGTWRLGALSSMTARRTVATV